MGTIVNRAEQFILEVSNLEAHQKSQEITMQKLDADIKHREETIEKSSREAELTLKAVEILNMVSDGSVQNSYKFITDNINQALSRIFVTSERKIRLKESTRGGMYPQLEVELIVENNTVRSLKEDSGHGIMQIISLLCILSLIVLNDGRRIMVIDEVLSGLSAKSRMIIDDILWAFAGIGFQFIVSEHGYIPRGSMVYQLEAVAGTSRIKRAYLQPNEQGVYLTATVSNSGISASQGSEGSQGSQGSQGEQAGQGSEASQVEQAPQAVTGFAGGTVISI